MLHYGVRDVHVTSWYVLQHGTVWCVCYSVMDVTMWRVLQFGVRVLQYGVYVTVGCVTI